MGKKGGVEVFERGAALSRHASGPFAGRKVERWRRIRRGVRVHLGRQAERYGGSGEVVARDVAGRQGRPCLSAETLGVVTRSSLRLC